MKINGKKDQGQRREEEGKNFRDNFSRGMKDHIQSKEVVEWTKLSQFVRESSIKRLKNYEESEMQEKDLNKT